MTKLTLGLFLLTLFSFNDLTAAQEFLSTKAERGDGIYSLLRKYELDEYPCNLKKFYQLNKLKRNAHLKAGKAYLIPILIYTYNGKTIRSSINKNDWDLAVSIQNYNVRMFELELKEQSFKKDKVLWVPFHYLNCPESSTRPAPPKDITGGITAHGRNFPIFGTKYAKTPLTDTKLKGQVYYIVSGHGGPDPGAMAKRGNYNLCEDEYAYDVALRLCRNLVAHGATAYMIVRDPNDGIRNDRFLKSDSDEVLWGNQKMSTVQKTRLFQRSDIINELYDKHEKQGVVVQKMICIHVDSRSKRERTDLFFYYQQKNKAGKKLAEAMRRTINSKYKKYRKKGQYLGTVSSRDLHMLRESKPLGIYVEMANIKNTADQQRIVLERNRQLIADWLFEGLVK